MNNKSFCSPRLRTTLHFMTLVMFVMISGCATQPISQIPDNQTSWQLKVDRYGHAAAAVKDKIFVFGGSSWGGRLANEIEIIDTQARTSTVTRIKIIPRRYARAVSDGKRYIYIVGGVYLGKKASIVPVIEKFDSQTLTVERITNQITPTRNPAVVLLHDKIYIAGGRNIMREGPEGYTPVLNIYDIAEDTWTNGADMPKAVGSRATELNGKMYIAGGYNGKAAINNLMEYDPLQDKWKSIAQMPHKVSANSLVGVNNKLFILGDYTRLNSSHSFDVMKNEWQSEVFDLIPARHSDAVVVGDKIYFIGGNVDSRDSVLGHIQILNVGP